MERADEPTPKPNDNMNNHMDVLIQVDWNDGETTWRANFTHASQFLQFKRNLAATRSRNITGIPFIQNIETVYY